MSDCQHDWKEYHRDAHTVFLCCNIHGCGLMLNRDLNSVRIEELTAELAAVKAKLAEAPEKESERWAERFNFLHTEYGSDCSGTDSGDLLDLVEAEVRQALESVKAERDAALSAVRLAIEHGSFPQGSGILHQLRDAAREG